ncbi:MAG: hypothetical protein O3B34_01475 [Bacteroidetes bacterium]|nr:hypothetical protein [Bacteroidota bacterium]
MFSTGQLIFAGLFFVGFVSLTILSYRKDKSVHQKQFKGSLWVLFFFILFVAVLTFLKYLLRK